MPSKKAAAMTKAKKRGNKQKAPPPKAVESGSDESSEEEEEMEASPAPAKNALKRKADKVQEKASKKAKKAAPPRELSNEEASEEEEKADSEDKEESEVKEQSSDKEDHDESSEEKVTKPAAKTGDSEEGTTLFLKNLPTDIEEDELRSLIEQEFTGSIAVRIPVSECQVRGFAFLDFGSSAEVDNAMENKQGAKLGGSTLILDRTATRKNIGKPRRGPDTLMFVKNLPEGYSEDELRSMLVNHFSDTNEVRLPTKRGGDLKGYAFVQFSTSAALNTALNDLQGSDLEGSSLFLDPVGQKTARNTGRYRRGRPKVEPGTTKTLFVKNLCCDTDPDCLKAAFNGAIGARISMKKSASFGFGFVEYDSTDAAQKAYNKMQNYNLDGRELLIEFAHERSNNSP